MHRNLQRLISYFLVLLTFSSCSPLISPYDQYSYTQTTSLKVDALNLMNYATEDYSQHETEIKAVGLSIQKQMEYEKYRPKNQFTNSQWSIINKPDGHLFGGFLTEWKNSKKLKPVYVNAKKAQISRAFDEIIRLESQKLK